MENIITGTASNRQITLDGFVIYLADSQAIVNHSASGFSWGYAGSGPAQAALGILQKFCRPSLLFVPNLTTIDKQKGATHVTEGMRPKLAERLRKTRLIDRGGISQTKAATEMDISLSTYHKAERYGVIPDTLLATITAWINANKRSNRRKEPALTV